jgi:hypothetical protein
VFFFPCYGYGYDLVLRFPQRFALLLWGLPGTVSTLSAERLIVCFVAFFLGFSYLPAFSAFTPAFSCGLSWVEGIPPSTSYVSPLPPLPLPSFFISACAYVPPLPSLLSLSYPPFWLSQLRPFWFYLLVSFIFGLHLLLVSLSLTAHLLF